MKQMAIVVVGYNRPDSMGRLLQSLLRADYEEGDVDLMISLDKSERQEELIALANGVSWAHGEKIIRAFPEKQGLRNHILQCGDLTKHYEAVVVLEDDLVVSPYFHSYVRQTLDRYGADDRIAGISLYTLQFHQGAGRPFEAVHTGYDVFFMQVAMSWGQCWTSRMWSGFRQWYDANKEKDLSEGTILPRYISRWSEQSWLKYFMRYLAESRTYFVYPYASLSTNASELGEHCKIPNNDYQVSMLDGRMRYRFPSLEQAVKYDIFFERLDLEDRIFPDLDGKKILDLYGGRAGWEDADYIISTAELPFRKIRELALQYRPMEMNCLYPQPGKGLYIYDAHMPAPQAAQDVNLLTRYDVRAISWKNLLRLGWAGFAGALKRKVGMK